MEEAIFLTGYSNENLQISKQKEILGWKQNSKRKELTNGDFIFVYNIQNKKIDSLFKIHTRIDTTDLIWKDEIKSGTIKYKNRWTADLITDKLNIDINEIKNINPFNSDPNRFFLFMKNPFPNFLDENYQEFRSFLLSKTKDPEYYKVNKNLRTTDIDQTNKAYFLIQVNRPGSINILKNKKYQHTDWKRNPRDYDHGKVNKGDILMIYFAGNSIDYEKQLKKIYKVNNVSEKNEYFDLTEEMELNGLSLNDIKNGIKNGKLTEVFKKISQQGFNIMKIDKTDFDSVIALDKELIQKTVEPSLWLVRAGERGQGAQTALDNNCVGIGYGSLPGLHHIKNFEAFKEHFQKTHPYDSESRIRMVVPQIWNFMYTIKVGDFVILPLPQKTKLMAVGKFIGDYQFENLHKEITQYRPVQWLKKDISVNEFDPEIQEWFDNRGTVHHIKGEYVVNKLKDMLKRLGVTDVELEKIDQINIKPIQVTDHKNESYLENKWLSLKETDIKEIVQNVLTANNKRLEIEEKVVQRIISHLMVAKHVILVGPPGTGKTDLARRILRELGSRIINNPEPVEAVASYEWGRYEVIGGRSIISNESENPFHFGCVTNAILKTRFLLIDEFNRADMNKAFGEMFLALDHGEIQLREDENVAGIDNNKIRIPSNFRMICTMNDYDKSLLNELSYGLLRRFAFVEINVPDDKVKVKDIVVERISSKLKNIGPNFNDKNVDQYIDKFIDFMFAIKPKREIGLASYIDVISYLMYSITVMKNDPAHALNDSLIDYILPQFDRLDIETIRLAYENASKIFIFKDENGNTIESKSPFLSNLNKRIQRLEELDKLFKFGEIG